MPDWHSKHKETENQQQIEVKRTWETKRKKKAKTVNWECYLSKQSLWEKGAHHSTFSFSAEIRGSRRLKRMQEAVTRGLSSLQQVNKASERRRQVPVAEEGRR